MPEVVDGEDWKYKAVGYAAERRPSVKIVRHSRARQQEEVDVAYATGRILREDWRKESDRIGNCQEDGHSLG